MRKSYFFWHKTEQRACLSYPWRVVNFRGHRQSSHSTFPLTSAKQLLTSSIIRNPSGGLKVIGHFEKCKIDSRAVPFQNKTTENLKKCHQIVQIDVRYGGGNSVSNTGNYSQSSREASSLPITDMQCISMEGSIPSRTFLRRKTLTGKSCWASEPVAVAASFSGLVILFLWLTPRDGTKARVHHYKQDWQ